MKRLFPIMFCLLLVPFLGHAQSPDTSIVITNDTTFALTNDIREGRLRSDPKLADNLILKMPTGSVVNIIGYKKGSPYLKVVYRDTVGWISFGTIGKSWNDAEVISELKKYYGTETTYTNSGRSKSKYSKPDPPYGEPDKTFDYESGSYKSVTYTYFCLNGEYRTFEYVKGKLGEWKLESKTTSDGICY